MTIEIALTLAIVALTLVLFISEKWPTDVNALIILCLLGLSSQLPGISPLINSNQLFAGFSSNAIIAIIALMIMAAGIQTTGAMNQVGRFIARLSSGKEWKTVFLLCSIAGVCSAFMQNIAAVALFIPVASYLSFQGNIPVSHLLMPMGFCVILGGNLSLLGNGSLIILNDLYGASLNSVSNSSTAEIGVFSVFPVGLALLAFGVLFFSFAPKSLFRSVSKERVESGNKNLRANYDLHEKAFVVPQDCELAGATIREFEERYQVQVFALRSGSRRETLAPYRSSHIEINAVLGISGKEHELRKLEEQAKLKLQDATYYFADLLHGQSAGYSEIVISSRSKLIGDTLHNSFFRKLYDATPVAISRKEKVIYGSKVNNTPLAAGDLLLLHSPRESLERVKDKKELISVKSDCPFNTVNSALSWRALVIFACSLALTIFTRIPVGLCLWLGVLGMFMFGVLKPNVGYNSVSWKTVIMLAGLIPLGIAVDQTGTAAWLSHYMVDGLPDNDLLIQFILAILTTLLTLFMSNVGATVLLVPIAINIANVTNLSPLLLVMLVGISSSNSFLIPTHQANAIILAAGRYKIKDFIKTGGKMTVAYICIEIMALNLLY